MEIFVIFCALGLAICILGYRFDSIRTGLMKKGYDRQTSDAIAMNILWRDGWRIADVFPDANSSSEEAERQAAKAMELAERERALAERERAFAAREASATGGAPTASQTDDVSDSH